MLQQVLQDAINSRNLSNRKAAREIGIAHTTVMRLLNGEKPSHDTLEKVAEWLGTPKEAFALIGREGNEGLASKIFLLLNQNPALAKSLEKAADKYVSGAISENDMEDILDYIDFRLSRD